jgi:hypothetical protein
VATFIETGVDARLVVKRDEEGNVVVIAEGRSVTSDGTFGRQAKVIITDKITANQLTGATNLLADVEARLRQQWEIT